MLKIMIVSAINPEHKAGYFNAVDDRVKLLKNDSQYNIASVSIYKSSSLFRMSIKRDQRHTFIEYPKIIPSDGILSFITILIIQLISSFYFIKLKPDIVHAHWGYPLGYAVVSLKTIFKKIKFVVTFHGSDVHTHPSRSKNILKKTISLCKHADHICAVSNQLIKIIKDDFCNDERKITLTYNGLIFDFSKGVRKYSDDPIFSFVGNLSYTKGADRIISLYEVLNKRLDSKFCFIVAGDGPERKKIETYIFNNNINNIFLLGAISRTDAINLIKISECLFILSRREGLGISAIEGVAYSNLCLATNVGGLPEIFLGNEHLLISGKFNPDLFADKIIKKRNNLIKMDRGYVVNNFSLEKMLNNEIKLYEHLVQTGY